ncbi:MAG: FKBP-type peptidyl-prolyl cis-trans isomerase [Prolixibacteraceae bacterium]|nr:FKBP-type peptidyl-prolyl cis-trans isomerase [Prolixibacteraceae bacterium]MBN2772691.1 FKBP-type peptidyl-prolyl cis-trans isomerase [Prolixibacteraceae bacterium]
MEIEVNKMVTLTYDLRIDDKNGELIEQATVESPLQFLFGAGMMLPKFESQLSGLKQGNPFEITLNKADAYGEVNNDAIVELPKHVFLVDGKFDDELIKVGNSVPMMSSNGQRLNGIVLDLSDDIIKMDFNHPLAGEDLYFSGNILEVRNASDEEINQILNPVGCGCGSGSCGTGDCGDDGCGADGNSSGCGCGC